MQKPSKITVAAFTIILLIGIASAGPQEKSVNPSDSQACSPCHLETFNEWTSSVHASAQERIGCTSCHEPHDGSTPSKPVMDLKKLCNSCHSQRAVLQGKGAKGIEETRSMHSNIACQDCHMTSGSHRMDIIQPDDPDLSEDRTDSCSPCHNEDSRDIRAAQIRDYHRHYTDGMAPLQADLQAIAAALEKNPELLDAELKKILDETKFNLSMIIEDGSEGFHNLPLSLEIFYYAKKNLAKIKEAVE